MTPKPGLALLAWLLAVVGGLAAIILRLVRGVPVAENTFALGDAGMGAFVLLGIVFASVGAVLVVRRPTNWIGSYLIVVGCGYGLSMLTTAVTSVAVADEGPASPVAGWAGWLTIVFTSVGGLALFFLAFVFPTGQAHSTAWDRLRRGLLVVGVLPWVLMVLLFPGPMHLFPGIDNPFGIGPDLRDVMSERTRAGLTTAGSALLGVLAIAAVASRYRAAATVERQQLKWFISAVTVSGVGLVLTGLVALTGRDARSEVPIVVYALAGTATPVAIGIAILRYRLYDIDRLVSRTLAYGLVSAMLVAVYGGSFLFLLVPLSSISGGQGFAVAASTLVVATLFHPLRRRIQAAVNRRFHRARYDAERTTAAFADRVRNEVEMSTLSAELDRTIRAVMEPSSLGLWLRDRR